MFGQPRSKANTPAFEKNYGKIDWKQPIATAEKPRRGVKVLTNGGFDCGIAKHNHDTFAQAAACVTGEGKR